MIRKSKPKLGGVRGAEGQKNGRERWWSGENKRIEQEKVMK